MYYLCLFICQSNVQQCPATSSNVQQPAVLLQKFYKNRLGGRCWTQPKTPWTLQSFVNQAINPIFRVCVHRPRQNFRFAKQIFHKNF